MGTKELNSIIGAIPVAFIKGVKASNVLPCSERSIRFDVPTADKDTIKRVKITALPEGFTVKLYTVTQTDQVDLVKPGSQPPAALFPRFQP